MANIFLPESRAAWNTPDFAAAIKREVGRLGGGQPGADPAGRYAGPLPLQQGLSASSEVLDAPIQVLLMRAWEEADGRLMARLGVFYAGLIAGCSCADDPTPPEAQNEYCELAVAIDPVTAEAVVTLWAEAEDED